MQHWLKKITPDRQMLEQRWYFRPFTAVVCDRGCWTFNRSSVIRAFSLGLAIAFVPPLPLIPIHLLICLGMGVALRLNLPVLIATIFISNPFTWVPQILGSIWVGAQLLGLDLMPMLNHPTPHGIWHHLSQLWAPLYLGALVLGAAAAAAGYVLAQLAWRVRVILQVRRRRSRLGAR